MDVNRISTQLSRLCLAEKTAICLEKTDADYVLHLNSQACKKCGEKAYIAASSSNYSIRIFSRDNLADVGAIRGHGSVVTGVKFSPEGEKILYSSSLDKTVRSWDFRASTTKPVQTFQGDSEVHLPICSFDINCNDKILCAGTEATKENDVYLMFWDRRKTNLLGCYTECHQDDITQVCFHPTNPDNLATGSTDGLVSIFDISQECEDDALTYTLNSESSVSRIGWYGPCDSRNVFCLTHIETFHIWDAVEGDPVLVMKDIRNNYEESTTKIDYLVDCFEMDSKLLLVTGDHSGQTHIFSVTDESLDAVCTLSGGHTDDVRGISWDSNTQTFITGGDDSMLCLWSPNMSKKACSNKDHLKRKEKIKKSSTPKTKPY